MIDIESEDLIDLRAACREKVFRNATTGKPLHISGMYRHVMRGARSVNGERVRLEFIRTPGGLRTSREAIVRFISALTVDVAQSLPTTAARRRQVKSAENELRAAGFEVGATA